MATRTRIPIPITLGQKGGSFSKNRKSSVSDLFVLLCWSIGYSLHYGSDLPLQVAEEEKPTPVPLKTRKYSAWRILFMLADIIGGIGCIEIPVCLQHGEKPHGKLLVFSVPALSTMFPERSHDEDV